MLKQIICAIKIRRAPTRHDNVDFKPIVTKSAEIKPLSIVVADKGYDSEENHILVREDLKAYSIIPAGIRKYLSGKHTASTGNR